GILLVWIIYPALIGYLAARRRRGVGARAGVTDPLPSVSVIIATRDDVETIRARIADCLGAAHDLDRFEVIIGVDALSPHTHPDDWSCRHAQVAHRSVATGHTRGGSGDAKRLSTPALALLERSGP